MTCTGPMRICFRVKISLIYSHPTFPRILHCYKGLCAAVDCRSMIAKGVCSAVSNPLNISVILKMEMMTNNPEQVHELCYYIPFAKNTRFTGCTTTLDGLEERLLGLH